MFGAKTRRIAELDRLAASRGERLTGATERARQLTDQKRRVMRRQDDLLKVVAVAITARTSPEQLRKAMLTAGFRAELEYALLEIPENTRPVKADQEVTPA